MKKMTTLLLLSAVMIAYSHTAVAQKSQGKKINVSSDVDTLGGNEELMKMAQSLRPETRSRIVQDRIVDRRNKVEFGLSYGGVLGGDAYLRTQSLGVLANYHITPRWSVGAQYFDYTNSLTSEGERVFNEARRSYSTGGRAYIVDIDYPLNAAVINLNWYPIYGKTSFLDIGVTQFDLYLLASAGQMQLSSGATPVYAGGLGIGAWLSRHVALRGEVKYQTYQDQLITGSRRLNTVNATLGLGWIL